MDESCKPIKFTSTGCNYCDSARERIQHINSPKQDEFSKFVDSIRNPSRQYDCVVGVSGGLDSTYLLCKLVEQGLRPLAVHMDNNWNSSVSSQNLRKVLSKLSVDLVSFVTPWSIQKEWQKAMISSNVPDLELLYDNCLHSVCYQVARERKIKTIIGGANLATEGVEVPQSWVWYKFDGVNLRKIAKTFGVKTNGYPIFTYKLWFYYTFIKKIAWASPLNLISSFSRQSGLDYLASNYDYVDYGQKHYENVFTRFYQGFILPRKFGFDKRLPHLSSEIVAGKLSRNEALEILKTDQYMHTPLAQFDRRYILAKLQISNSDFDAYLSSTPKKHEDYGQEFFGRIIRGLINLRVKFNSSR